MKTLKDASIEELRRELSKKVKDARRAKYKALKEEKERKAKEHEKLVRRIFLMREGGANFREIGEELGLKHHNVGALYQRYKDRQRRKLETERELAKLTAKHGDQAILHLPFHLLPFSTRTLNALQQRIPGEGTALHILKLTDYDMKWMKNFGPSCKREVDFWLEEHGLERERVREEDV